MNLLNSSKLLSRSLIGAVGLSASVIAVLGLPQAAKVANVQAGSDYWQTALGTFFDFGGVMGLPKVPVACKKASASSLL